MDEVKGNTSTVRRRVSVALVSVVMGVGLLAACGSDDKPASSTPSTPTTVRASTTVAGATTTAAPGTTAAGSTATSVAGSTAPGTTTAATGQYSVAGGDSLFSIAKKFCITMDALVAANGWTDGINHVIHPNDVITIPAGACAASTAATTTTKAAATTTAGGATTTTKAAATTTTKA